MFEFVWLCFVGGRRRARARTSLYKNNIWNFFDNKKFNTYNIINSERAENKTKLIQEAS
jgi:hypothetical protein